MTTALEVARELASHVEPETAARRCGFDYAGSPGAGTLSVVFLGRPIELSFPDFVGRFTDRAGAVPEPIAAMLAYHLATSDGAEPIGEWISFADLPDGRFYCSSWRGYTGRTLSARFGNELQAVRAAARGSGATEMELAADLAFRFPVMPKVPVALLYWAGDKEFEPRADFLFDKTAAHHLPTDAYAVVCKWLTDEMVRRASPER